MKAISIIYRFMTQTEFKAINNLIQSSGGGSQTYIDFPKGSVKDSDWIDFLGGIKVYPVLSVRFTKTIF